MSPSAGAGGCHRVAWQADLLTGVAVSAPARDLASAPAWRTSAGYGAGGQGGSEYHYMDVHGAGAQRSDPKAGDPAMFPHGRGPQGDVIRIYNYVRLVRSGLPP